MKKLGFFGLVLVCSVFLTGSVSYAAAIIVPTNQPTIQDAVNAASNGDVIEILAGTYKESVTVTKSVTIYGAAGKLKTFVVAPAATNYAFWVIASDVVIRGLTIRGGTSNSGISINSQNVRVAGCTVEKSAFGIIIGDGGSHARIVSNQIRYCTQSSGLTFPNLVVGTGITVVSTFGGDITDVYMGFNQVNDNDLYGIWVFGYTGTASYDGMKLEYNTLVNNGSSDPIGSSNWNMYGFDFQNASGTITMNYNHVLATMVPGWELVVLGPNTPTFTGTGNIIYPNFRDSMAGPGSPLTLP